MRDDIERAESRSSTASEKRDPEKDQIQELSETDVEAAGVGAQEEEHGPLEKTASRKSKHSVNNISSVPNGGLLAWMQVLGAFFLFFNSW